MKFPLVLAAYNLKLPINFVLAFWGFAGAVDITEETIRRERREKRRDLRVAKGSERARFWLPRRWPILKIW
jgi:hypothetical protein